MSETFRIKFFPDDVTADVVSGTLISDAAKSAGVTLRLPCNGKGRCGRCNVIIHGKTECSSVRVLACQTAIDKDMTVSIPFEEGKIIASNDHRKIVLDDLDPMVAPDGKNKYGLAVDIGTTTVAVAMVDLASGIDLYVASGYNKQGILGDDVLSRMEYAADHGTEELRKLVVDVINDLIDSFEDTGMTKDGIVAVCISANTTMTHLFLGIDPSPMREPPYEPVVKEAIIRGKESGLNVNPNATVFCMPSLSAYVGGDITSDITASKIDQDDELALLVDVGTNGEVALGNKDVLLACSSSAGPAFEGGKMSSGMMAKPGAIDSFRITNSKFEYTVIGGIEPKGICGSGLIDILAQLLINGLIDRKGHFTSKAVTKVADNGIPYIVIEGSVIISEDDIQNAIMTKAAIYSASRSLMRELGVKNDDVSKVYIAGGFGSFINMESAITIGMFPDVPRERFFYMGNASLAGAKQMLLSRTSRERTASFFPTMTYVDLSSSPIFSDEYTSSLFLPNTDMSQFPSAGKSGNL